MSEKNTAKVGEKLTPPSNPPKPKTAEELAAWEKELSEREARNKAEEAALKDRESAIESASKKSGVVDRGPGIIASDIDVSKAPEEVKRGADVKANSADRRAYHKWVKETYGVVPKKAFNVEIRKQNSVVQSYENIHATDEADAIRIAYSRAGLANESNAYSPRVIKMGNAAA